MLKKGQPGWIENHHRPFPVVVTPLLSHICNKNGEMIDLVRWPARKIRHKRFGISERWKRCGYLGNTEWKRWYITARDRNEALIALKKGTWASKKTFKTIER